MLVRYRTSSSPDCGLIIIGSWLHSRHSRISQTTNTPGLFFVWRLVRAIKRYSTRPSSFYFFKNLSLTFLPVTCALGRACTHLAYVPPEGILRTATFPRIVRLGPPRPSCTTFTCPNSRTFRANSDRCCALGGSHRREHELFPHYPASPRERRPRVER